MNDTLIGFLVATISMSTPLANKAPANNDKSIDTAFLSTDDYMHIPPQSTNNNMKRAQYAIREDEMIPMPEYLSLVKQVPMHGHYSFSCCESTRSRTVGNNMHYQNYERNSKIFSGPRKSRKYQ